tara:strand:+ start:1150 stop:1425 length:276 start_codon:yes stop_codon:yes gene_type:complete
MKMNDLMNDLTKDLTKEELCSIKELVLDLVLDFTKSELQTMLRDFKPIEVLCHTQVPESQVGRIFKAETMLYVRCLRMAIAYLEESEKNEI